MASGEQNCLFQDFTLILLQSLVVSPSLAFGLGGVVLPAPASPIFLLPRGTATEQLVPATFPFGVGASWPRGRFALMRFAVAEGRTFST